MSVFNIPSIVRTEPMLQDDGKREYECTPLECGYDGDQYCQRCGYAKGEYNPATATDPGGPKRYGTMVEALCQAFVDGAAFVIRMDTGRDLAQEERTLLYERAVTRFASQSEEGSTDG
jgi:hypothetical protein